MVWDVGLEVYWPQEITWKFLESPALPLRVVEVCRVFCPYTECPRTIALFATMFLFISFSVGLFLWLLLLLISPFCSFFYFLNNSSSFDTSFPASNSPPKFICFVVVIGIFVKSKSWLVRGDEGSLYFQLLPTSQIKLLSYFDKLLLYSPGWPWTHAPPASASRVLGL
jgi:hypothetical protein